MPKKYILKEEELESLVREFTTHGGEKTYEKLSQKIGEVFNYDNNLDSMLMDMYDALVERARVCAEEDEKRIILYDIASITRRVAHQTHRRYIKSGKERSNEKFLHSV